MTEDQRARANAAFADLGRASDAIKAVIKEQSRDLNAAVLEIGRLRALAERLQSEAESLRAERLQIERSSDESALAASEAEAALAAEQARTAGLRADLDALRGAAPPASRPHGRSAPPRQPTDARPTDARPTDARPSGERTAASRVPDSALPESQKVDVSAPEAVVGEAFRAWCGAATPVMGKADFFAAHVRSALPGAAVTAVYRDANSQASPPALSARGGASPVEYWLVALDGRHWLLPHPMTAAQFRELAPCFEGHATPTALAEVVPADVRVVGDRFEVPHPGRVA